MKGIMGLIEKDGKFLFGIESKESPRKGKWRLLGGKLEGNESSEHAMIRECLEEANIKVKVQNFLGNVTIEAGDITIDLCVCKWVFGEVKAKVDEISKLEWFSIEEAKKLDKDYVSELALKMYEDLYFNFI